MITNSIFELVFEPRQVKLEIRSIHQLFAPTRQLGDDARRLQRHTRHKHFQTCFETRVMTSDVTWLTMKGSWRLSMPRKGDHTDCFVLRAYSLNISTRDLSSCKQSKWPHLAYKCRTVLILSTASHAPAACRRASLKCIALFDLLLCCPLS